jgi:hypothetical protein
VPFVDDLDPGRLPEQATRPVIEFVGSVCATAALMSLAKTPEQRGIGQGAQASHSMSTARPPSSGSTPSSAAGSLEEIDGVGHPGARESTGPGNLTDDADRAMFALSHLRPFVFSRVAASCCWSARRVLRMLPALDDVGGTATRVLGPLAARGRDARSGEVAGLRRGLGSLNGQVSNVRECVSPRRKPDREETA